MPTTPEDAHSNMPPGPVRTVLYVEDNADNLALVTQLLGRRADLALVSAADGDAGIALARARLPELILMDINLPGISGMDTMKLLRGDPLTAAIPVIALSSNAFPRQIRDGLEAGFFGYLTKPFKFDEFLTAVESALAHAARTGPAA
ncbi:response regulator [Massilia glaciei]|nr:response regulator [Massilia glaciei]